MKVRVTGASGFIGSHVVRLLEERGHVVNNTLELDALIHLRAWANVLGCEYDYSQAIRRNVEQTADVVNNAAERGSCFTLYASTVSVYSSSTRPVAQLSNLGPHNFYAHTKLLGEMTAQYLTPGRFVSLRMPNVFGPGQEGGKAHGVVARWLHALVNGETPVVYRGENLERDYVYVKDVAWEIINLLEGIQGGRDALILASGKQVSPEQLWEYVALEWERQTGSPPDCEFVDKDHGLYPHHVGIYPDVRCIRPLTAGIRLTVQHWLDQR